MTSRRPDLPIFFVVSKLEPEDRTESSDEDEEPGGSSQSRKKIRESEVQSRKKQRVYERLIKHGFLSAKTVVDMDQNERFHGLSAWRIQRYNEMKKNPDASSDDFTGYIEAFDRFQESLKKFAEESLRARVEHVCQILIRVLSRCLDFFIQKTKLLKKGKELMQKTLHTLLEEESEVHENISRSLDKEENDIQDELTATFNGAHDGILREAEMFEYDLTEFTIPQSGVVTQTAAVGHCQDQLERMVISKLQGEIKDTLSMMFHSRDLFFTQIKDRIEQIEDEIAADREIPSAALALGRSLLSSYEAQITFAKQEGGILSFFKKVAIWLKDTISHPKTAVVATAVASAIVGTPPVPSLETIVKTVKGDVPVSTFVNTVKGNVPVGSPAWKKKVASNVLKKVDPSKMANEIVTNLKEHFRTCHEEFTGEINKVQDLFNRGETISDEQMGKAVEFAPNLALQEMLAYSVLDRLKFGLPRKGDLVGTGAQGIVFACDNVTTPEGKPCVVKVVGVASVEVLKDLSLELHNVRYKKQGLELKSDKTDFLIATESDVVE